MTPRNTILVGDAATRLRDLETSSIDCVITSPPYFRLRTTSSRGRSGWSRRSTSGSPPSAR